MIDKVLSTFLQIVIIASAVFNVFIALTVLFRKQLVFNCLIYTGELLVTDALFIILLRTTLNVTQSIMLFCIIAALWIIFCIAVKLMNLNHFRLYCSRNIRPQEMDAKLNELKTELGEYSGEFYLYGDDKKSPYNMLVFRKTDKSIIKKVKNDINKFLSENGKFSAAPIIAIIFNIAAIIVAYICIY